MKDNITVKDSELLKLALNFIKENLSINSNFKNSLKELKKLTEFLSIININYDYYFFIELVDNSDVLKNLLNIIISNNKNLIWITSSLNELLNDEILLSLIDAYCILNNIDNYDNSIIFGNKLVSNMMSLYRKDLNMLSVSGYSDEELLKQINEGNKEAKDILIEKYLKLVLKIAKKYVGKGLDYEDLVQEGNIGLMKAVDKFDSSKGVKFATYATWWIFQEIGRTINSKFYDIYIPEYFRRNYYQFLKEYNNLKEELKREPTYDEMALKMHLSVSQIWQLYAMSKNFLSLDSIDNSEEFDKLDFSNDTILNVDEYIETKDFKQEILLILENSGLSDKEIKVILLRYGFYSGEKFNLITTAKIVNVSVEWARQLEIRALKKMTNSCYAERLAMYTSDPQKTLSELKKLTEFYNEQGCYCCRKRFKN